MNNKLFLLLSCFCLLMTCNAFAKQNLLLESEKNQCVFLGPKPSLIIKLKNQSSSFSNQNLLKANSLNKLAELTLSSSRPMSGGAYITSFPPQATSQIKPGCYAKTKVKELVDRIKAREEVEYVVPNVILFPLNNQSNSGSNPPVGTIPIQWNLLSPPGGTNAQDAWQITRGSENAIIAVLDGGQLSHPALDSNTIPGVYFVENGTFGIGAEPWCDRREKGKPCKYNDHGTHVAGIVAASGVLAYGQNIYGVAPKSKILPINPFTQVPYWDDEEDTELDGDMLYASDLINALNWLAGDQFPNLPPAPASVVGVNMSFGYPGECIAPLQLAIDRLTSKNISIATAAGNSNADANREAPINCRGVIPVASILRKGSRAPYSSYGNIVKIAAPGGGWDFESGDFDMNNFIYSTAGGGYVHMSGTSMASPHVAGLFALLYSVDPTLTPEKVLNILQETATPFPASQDSERNCKGIKSCGAGIMNALAAVHKAKDQAAILAWNPTPQVSIINQSQANVSWQPAQWHPARATPIVYTVYLDGSEVAHCKNMTSTTCPLSQLDPTKQYAIFVKATDNRNLYPPVQSSAASFSTFVVVPPILSSVARNPLWKSQAWINYSQLGSSRADCVYTVNGLANTRVSLDVNKSRFVISDAGKGKANIAIIVRCGNQSAVSNFLALPSI